MKRVHPVVVSIVVLLVSGFTISVRGARFDDEKKSIRLTGAVEKPVDLTVESVNKDFEKDIKTIAYTLKGVKGESRCLSLLTLVQSAKPLIDAKIKNHQLAFIVVVRAEDGYTAAFSLGELLPAYGKRDVWLALDSDGKPLPDKIGPIELIVPDDQKPSRWVHRVSSITVVDTMHANSAVK